MADTITIREPPAGTAAAGGPAPGDAEGGVATTLRDRYELERLRAETPGWTRQT